MALSEGLEQRHIELLCLLPGVAGLYLGGELVHGAGNTRRTAVMREIELSAEKESDHQQWQAQPG